MKCIFKQRKYLHWQLELPISPYNVLDVFYVLSVVMVMGRRHELCSTGKFWLICCFILLTVVLSQCIPKQHSALLSTLCKFIVPHSNSDAFPLSCTPRLILRFSQSHPMVFHSIFWVHACKLLFSWTLSYFCTLLLSQCFANKLSQMHAPA